MYTRKAFTMIELVFVIVVLGILASIAIPKFAATRDDAQISNARATVAAIRSGIVSVRQKYMLRGITTYINKLSSGSGDLFDGNGTAGTQILMYPIKPTTTSQNGHWSRTNDTTYNVYIKGKACTFTYSPTDGTFTLNSTHDTACDPLDF